MIFVGVDPGKIGAIAALSGDNELDSELIQVFPMPTLAPTSKKGRQTSRREYDVPAIRDLLFQLGPLDDLFVTVEKPQHIPPRRKGSSAANFEAGGQLRGWEFMLTALRVRFHFAQPRAWQKVMHAGLSGEDTKRKSILAAQRLFPNVDYRRTPQCRKDDDGIAEALLIASYGMRTYEGKI